MHLILKLLIFNITLNFEVMTNQIINITFSERFFIALGDVSRGPISLGPIIAMIEKEIPGIYIKSIRIGKNDFEVRRMLLTNVILTKHLHVL